MTPRRPLADINDHRLREDMMEPREPNDPIDKTEQADPIEPRDRIEPTLPIDRKDPFEPIERNESSDHSDQRDVVIGWVMAGQSQWGTAKRARPPWVRIRTSCHGSWRTAASSIRARDRSRQSTRRRSEESCDAKDAVRSHLRKGRRAPAPQNQRNRRQGRRVCPEERPPNCGSALARSRRIRHSVRVSEANPGDRSLDSVVLLQTSAPQAETIAARLRSEGIPAMLFDGTTPSGSAELGLRSLGARVMVRRGDVERAALLVKDLFDIDLQD